MNWAGNDVVPEQLKQGAGLLCAGGTVTIW